MAATNANAINYFSPAKWVVSKVAGEGTHTTIASAIASASAGDTIVIMPATAYSENLTLTAGINLVAFQSDSSLNATGNVQITGKATFTGTGTVTISGIQLNTNSDFFLVVSGSNASVVNLNNCYLNCSNNTGISFTSSNASAGVNLFYSMGNIGTTGIAFWSMSGAGVLNISYCGLNNTGASTTSSSNSSGIVEISYSSLGFALSNSSTGVILTYTSQINTAGINTIGITTAGSGSSAIDFTKISSGTASAISIGTGTTLTANQCEIASTNTNAITGAGTFNYGAVEFTNTSTINTTTQNPIAWPVFQGGTGLTATTANDILYSSAANTISQIATANTAVLTTNSSGVPSMVAAGTSYTPTCVGASTAGTTSYTVQQGRYIQIGPLVIVSFNVQGTFGATAAGNVNVSLPVACITSTNYSVYGAGIGVVNSVGVAGAWNVKSGVSVMGFFIQTTNAFLNVTLSDTFICAGTMSYFSA